MGTVRMIKYRNLSFNSTSSLRKTSNKEYDLPDLRKETRFSLTILFHSQILHSASTTLVWPFKEPSQVY